MQILLNFKSIKICHIFQKSNEVVDASTNDAVRIEDHLHIHWNSHKNVYKFISFDGGRKTLPKLAENSNR